MLSDATRRLLGGTFELAPIDDLELKGFDERITAWRVMGEGVRRGRFEARQGANLGRMIGRDQELALLRQRWTEAQSGEGQAILLVGEAGIGKSRLTRGLRDAIAEGPHTEAHWQPMHQHIEYCTSADGVRLAYSVTGVGSPIVRTSHWLTHLEYDLKSPVTRHMVLGLSQRHAFVRYDARGEGLSQRDVSEISFERWVTDLEAIVDRLDLKRLALFGMSQGAPLAIEYAVRHPERVSHLILCGGYARGLLHRGDPERQKKILELSRGLVREGWGSDEEAYRQWFTSQFIPEATAEQSHWFNELERISATQEVAERHVVAAAEINVADRLAKIRAPTLVLHCTGDQRMPFELGQELAANIPGAKFVPLASKNHILLPNDPAYREFLVAVAAFLGDPPIKGALPGTATPKERLEGAVKSVEQNWFVKIVVLLAAITGVVIFGLEMWRLAHH